MTTYAVVGAGLAGSATAWRLAARGHDVILLEATRPAHEHGSSHGSARIFRYAYPDPFWTELVLRSRPGWDELEEAAGAQIIRRTGALDFGDRRDVRRLADVLLNAGVRHTLMSAAEAAQRWLGLQFETEVLWHPDAGVIDAQAAVEAMVELARRAGAVVLTDWRLASVTRHRGRFALVPGDGAAGSEIVADHVVIAAGGWLSDVVANLGDDGAIARRLPHLRVSQEQAFHFPYREDAATWPSFIYKSAAMQSYGLPGGRDAGFAGQKVAEYNGGRLISSARESDGTVDPANRRRVVEYVRHHLPGLRPEPYAETTCLFTNTPDEEFVIDTINNITIVSPCSGHGAKFAPLIGTLAAASATGDVGAHSQALERFAMTSPAGRR